MNDLNEIINYLELSDRIGTAGQPTEAQFRAVLEAGYRTVINLALSTSAGALPNERDIVESLGLEYLHLPVEWDAPTLEDARQFFRVMEEREEKKCFVHCAMNMRVSAFLYLYRTIHDGIPKAEAEAAMHRIWTPNERWRQFLHTMEDRY